MKVREAFKRTQDYYRVRGKELAERAGIGVPHLSSIRSGKSWPSEETLENLLQALEALAPGSRRHFCTLLAGVSLLDLDLEDLGDAELGEFLIRASDEMGRRLLKKSRRNTLAEDRVEVKAG